MKPLVTMDENEQIEFAMGALRIIETTRRVQGETPEFRLALIALWCVNTERPLANLKTHYEVDPSNFLDEVVRAGTIFFENLQEMMKDPPPDIPVENVEWMRGRSAEHIRTLRDPRYRAFIVRAWEGFLEDLKEYGE